MATSEQPRGDPPAPAEPENLSAFMARVLNQLSLSAWLPGAFFIVCAALLLWFRSTDEISLGQLGSDVEKNWIPVLVLALPALVTTTLLTQAFSFGAIRSLEGYWRRRGPASWLRTRCIKCQKHRKLSLIKRQRAALAKSFRASRTALLERGVGLAALIAVEADYDSARRPLDMSKQQHAAANELLLSWVADCEPWYAAKLLRFDLDLQEFPDDSRTMPTKLGNILRTTEDGIRNRGENLAGFVMRNRQFVPPRILEHHDQYRTRLDMYCTLVFVAATLTILSVPTLWGLPLVYSISLPVLLFITTLTSYGAALSSARGYVTALREIDEVLEEKEDQKQEGVEPGPPDAPA